MTTEEIANLFVQYTDEADQTFMSQTDVVTFLNLAYNQFRSIVSEQDNYFYANIVTLPPVTATQQYDLALGTNPVRILGNPATLTNPKMYRLIRIGLDNGQGIGLSTYYLMPARSSVDVNGDINRYMLRGSVLFFSSLTPLSVNIEYLPYPSTLFTTANILTGAGVFLDDLDAFHDIIALLAYRHYAIKDFASNPVLEGQLQDRVSDLKEYLSSGRSFTARSFVVNSDEKDYLSY
jgi:hypothetical protein